MNQDIRKLYDELINPKSSLSEKEFLEKLIKFEDYTKINIYRTLLRKNNKEIVRKSKEYRAIKSLNPYSIEQVKKDNQIRDKLEKDAISNLIGEKVSIKDIINIYTDNINNILEQKVDIKEKLNELNIVYVEVEGVILPPEGEERIITGSGKGVEKKEGFDRFSLLLKRVLNANNGFYTGDYRVIIGKNRKNMMRESSYIVIEIPKINKTIFVNNEYGEATFIYDGIPFDSEIQEKGKLSYKSEFNKIKFINPDQWVEQVKEGLSNSKQGEENKFENVEAKELGSFFDKEEKKRYIIDLFKSKPELEDKRFGLNTKERAIFKIDNLGYHAIAKIFGFEGANNNEFRKDKIFIELSKKIFGEDHPKIVELEKNLIKLSQEDIKNIFENNKVLENERFSLNAKTRPRFKIDNLGYIAIARIFGFEGYGYELFKDKIFIELSKKIFGEDHPKIVELEKKLIKLSQEDIKNIFENNKVLEDKRFGLNTKERAIFKIDNLGYISIAKIFGFEGANNNEFRKDKFFIELSKKIFGEDHPKIVELEKNLIKLSQEDIKNIFENNKVLENERFSLNTTTRPKFKIDNLGYISIAKIFGFEGANNNEFRKDKIFIELSKRIFGKNHPRVVELENKYNK